MIEIKVVTKDLIADVETVFCSNKSIDGCSCMWFILPVKDYHAGGRDQNRLKFRELIQTEQYPVGLLGFLDNAPIILLIWRSACIL
jgi:hypothetical protein